ncbi:MAG TPA: immune inhibitor A domain-containing protein, partial [Thermodesulfovibrionia bacterium]|nr:immune inhibitor A domain-containing protein [Thermodesulfovibrionia bacterium]
EEGRIGVMSHELRHLLMKYPELYDTDYGSRGTGNWDLMGGGSWNNGGETPAHPTAWCKVKSGWIKPVTIFNDEQIVTIPPYAKNPVGYKLPVGNVDSKEYFLLSNRKQTGFDKKIPGEGLIIEHCDDNQPDNNDETHYLVNLEQCDGKMDLNENVNRGDSTDPFPCPGNDKFTADSNPNSRAYDGSDTRISVTSIKRVGDNIQAVINVGGKYIQKWHDNVTVSRTFATVQSQNAWVYIEPLGWRKISTTSPDGVSNMLILFCEAMAGNIKVNVYIDAEFVYRVQSA